MFLCYRVNFGKMYRIQSVLVNKGKDGEEEERVEIVKQRLKMILK